MYQLLWETCVRPVYTPSLLPLLASWAGHLDNPLLLAHTHLLPPDDAGAC